MYYQWREFQISLHFQQSNHTNIFVRHYNSMPVLVSTLNTTRISQVATCYLSLALSNEGDNGQVSDNNPMVNRYQLLTLLNVCRVKLETFLYCFPINNWIKLQTMWRWLLFQSRTVNMCSMTSLPQLVATHVSQENFHQSANSASCYKCLAAKCQPTIAAQGIESMYCLPIDTN